jgi:hypothetical protein
MRVSTACVLVKGGPSCSLPALVGNTSAQKYSTETPHAQSLSLSRPPVNSMPASSPMYIQPPSRPTYGSQVDTAAAYSATLNANKKKKAKVNSPLSSTRVLKVRFCPFQISGHSNRRSFRLRSWRRRRRRRRCKRCTRRLPTFLEVCYV